MRDARLVNGTSGARSARQSSEIQSALDGKAPLAHTQAASTISDSTSVGRAVLTAADAAAARVAIGINQSVATSASPSFQTITATSELVVDSGTDRLRIFGNNYHAYICGADKTNPDNWSTNYFWWDQPNGRWTFDSVPWYNNGTLVRPLALADGSNASGTWVIDIDGDAATAAKSSNPVFIVPAPVSTTEGGELQLKFDNGYGTTYTCSIDLYRPGTSPQFRVWVDSNFAFMVDGTGAYWKATGDYEKLFVASDATTTPTANKLVKRNASGEAVSTGQILENNYPYLEFYDTDAALNQKRFRLAAQSGFLSFMAFDDSRNWVSTGITLAYNGDVNVPNGKLYVNSNQVWHAGNDGAGSQVDAGKVAGRTPSAVGLNVLDAASDSAARAAIGVSYGTSAGTVCQGNDSRLSDARPATASSTHTFVIPGWTAFEGGQVNLEPASGQSYGTVYVDNMGGSGRIFNSTDGKVFNFWVDYGGAFWSGADGVTKTLAMTGGSPSFSALTSTGDFTYGSGSYQLRLSESSGSPNFTGRKLDNSGYTNNLFKWDQPNQRWSFTSDLYVGGYAVVLSNDSRLTDARPTTSSAISDSTAIGRAVLTAASASAAQDAIDLGVNDIVSFQDITASRYLIVGTALGRLRVSDTSDKAMFAGRNAGNTGYSTVYFGWDQPQQRWFFDAAPYVGGHAVATLNAPSFTGTVTIGGNEAWHAGNGGAGSQLDAGKLAGKTPSTVGLEMLEAADRVAARLAAGINQGVSTTHSPEFAGLFITGDAVLADVFTSLIAGNDSYGQLALYGTDESNGGVVAIKGSNHASQPGQVRIFADANASATGSDALVFGTHLGGFSYSPKLVMNREGVFDFDYAPTVAGVAVSLDNHNHSGVYQPAGSYALSSHNHTGVYAAASHTHSEYQPAFSGTPWTNLNDGLGSALEAGNSGLLSGMAASTSGTGNTIAARDSSGRLSATEISLSSGTGNPPLEVKRQTNGVAAGFYCLNYSTSSAALNLEVYNTGEGKITSPSNLILSGSTVRVDCVLKPGADGSYTLGASGAKWSAVHATNGTIQTSDERLKAEIAVIDDTKADDLLRNLSPIEFKWRDQKHDRLNWGFSAQELERLLGDGSGETFGDHSALDRDYETDSYGINYAGLVPVLWRAVQKQREMISVLEHRLSKLERMMS